MRQNVITIEKGGRKAKVVESSFEAVWKSLGWSKAAAEGNANASENESQAEGDKTPAKAGPEAKSPDRGPAPQK
jgi:hypothetical protein